MTLKVFCDFDGTIVPEDVGDAFFRSYGGETADAAIRSYSDGTITARECLRRAAESVPHVTRGEFEAFVDRYNVDRTFGSFLDWCGANGAEVMVVSDGLDAYVGRILEKAGYGGVPYRANVAEFDVDTEAGLRVSFPFGDEECDISANCKRNHVVTQSGDDDVVIYVGDGRSDRCAVGYADIVFARGSLISYCQEKNITYHTFRDFSEVLQRLNGLGETRGLKQRREAAMARRAIFQRG